MDVAFTTDIAVAPPKLWPWIVEPERMKQWMRGLESIEFEGAGGYRPGARARMVIKEGARLSSYDFEVTACEPARLLAITVRPPKNKGFEMTCRYELVPQAGALTRLDYSGEMRTERMLWRVVCFLFGWAMKLQAKSFMKTLKKLAEAPTTA